MSRNVYSVSIVQTNNRQRVFYSWVGPFLGRRQIAGELGGQVWNDDNKVWWVALAKGDPVGCVACQWLGPDRAVFASDYVRPDFRGQGIYGQLFEARLESVAASVHVEATATKESLGTFLKHGFKKVRQIGSRYTRVARAAS